MNGFLRLCAIISIIIASLKLGMIGGLTPGMTTFIIICGLLILIGNRAMFIVAAAVAGSVLFTKVYGGSTEGEAALLHSVLTLALVVFGMYIIVKGIFPSNRQHRRW